MFRVPCVFVAAEIERLLGRLRWSQRSSRPTVADVIERSEFSSNVIWLVVGGGCGATRPMCAYSGERDQRFRLKVIADSGVSVSGSRLESRHSECEGGAFVRTRAMRWKTRT